MPPKKFYHVKGDIEILMWVYQLRLARVDHLMALTGRWQQALSRRLAKLTKHKYLYRRRSNLFEKHVYTINRVAEPILVEQGIASKESVAFQVRRLRELTDLFLKHALMLTDIHVALERASRTSPIKLTDWREGNELYDSVTILENGEHTKYPVRPDAFFTLTDTSGNRFHFFLEADRSTMTNKRYQSKLKGYWAYIANGLQKKKYGITGARVITLTLTQGRARNLCEAARDAIPPRDQKFYYFAPVKHFTSTDESHVFDNIFMSPRDFDQSIRYSLIPPLAK